MIELADSLDINLPVMLKAQIPVGGRGKAGGILGASTMDEANAGIEKLLSTWIRGYKPTRILVEEKTEIEREFYLAITYDTVVKSPMAIFSAEGGIEIETLAKTKPKKIRNEHFSKEQDCRNTAPGKLLRKRGSQANSCSLWGPFLHGWPTCFWIMMRPWRK